MTEAIWALTKAGDPKPSNQVFMGAAWSPAEDWEKNAWYVPGLDFLSNDYLHGVTQADVTGWKQFFLAAGAKDAGERNHVETFAMAFVEEKLSGELSDFVPKNRQQVGYDREARRRSDGALVRLEIKGQKADQAVKLEGNEPSAARRAATNEEPFWVCIVSGIPANPHLWVVEDALQAGEFETLTIEVSQWRAHGRRIE